VPIKATPTFSEYSQQFMKAMQASDRAKGTLYNYRSLLDKWLLPALGDKHLSAITSADVHDLMDDMAIQTGPVARAHAYNLLQVMMKLAHSRWAYIGPWTVRVEKAGGDHSKKPQEFTLEQARSAIGFMPDYMRPALLVALGSALRIGEVCGLAKGDWNSEERKLTVAQQYSLGEITETKTRFVGSIFPIMEAPTLLDEWTKNPSPWQGAGDAMFRGPRGARLHPVAIRDEWGRARKWAKVPTMRLHDIRHVSLTTYARIPGVTLADIAAFGRHRSIQSALRYQHAQDANRLRSLSAFTWDEPDADDSDDMGKQVSA
jgi:integrase